MYRKIIIGYDGSASAQDAVALAQAIGASSNAELLVTGVFPHGRFVDKEQEAAFASKVQAAADLIGAKAETFPSSSPAHGLHDAAEELDADLIVVGSAHGTESGHMSAGDVGVQLLHGAPCAVAVAPAGLRDGGESFRTIGVALNGSQESLEALGAAIELARAFGGGLRLMTVSASADSASGWGYGVFELNTEMHEIYQGHLDEAAKLVPDGLEVTSEVLTGAPVWELLDRAADEVDLLCIGSRGYGPVRRVLLGSVSSHLVKHASGVVLVVPRGAAVDPSEPSAQLTAEPAW